MNDPGPGRSIPPALRMSVRQLDKRGRRGIVTLLNAKANAAGDLRQFGVAAVLRQLAVLVDDIADDDPPSNDPDE